MQNVIFLVIYCALVVAEYWGQHSDYCKTKSKYEANMEK